jgi:hypothetical protein
LDFAGIGHLSRSATRSAASQQRNTRPEVHEENGAPAIDLADGEALYGRLKDLQLGISVRLLEQIEVDPSFFDAI